MAPRIDFVYLTHLFDEFERLADWQALLERATLPTVATDYAVGPALEHALVDLLGLDWETAEDYEGFYADYREFVRLVRRKRNAYQEQEVMQLHRLWQEKGGMSELSADMKLEDVLRKFQGDVSHLIQGGQAMVGDLFTLPIDPALLNGGLTNFKLGRGQIMFLAALVVVTGKYDYNAQKLPSTAQEADTNIKTLKWKKLPIDWRRGYVILRDMGNNKSWWQQFEGLEGYGEFTFRYADGDMQKGFMIASALLEMQGMRGIGQVLKWQVLPIKTSQLPQLKKALDDLLAEASKPNYDALGEYTTWSNTWVGGDMQKGFSIASALLEMQGKGVIGQVLKWQALPIKTTQLSKIKQALDDLITKADQPNYDALGEYTSWSNTWAGGDMHKGFIIASALLEMQGKGEIGQVLKWQGLPIKTTQLSKIKQALDDLITKAEQPNYDALGEYASWSNTWAGGDMHKGFIIASALLEMQGKGVIGQVLKWQQLHIKTTQLSQIKKALDELLAEASKPNYDAFGKYVSWSNTWVGGDMQKGFSIASALLEMQGKGVIGQVLKWQQLHIKTTQLSQIKKALDELLAEASKPNYDALGEYVSWSNTWAGGDMQKGFKIASALLEMQGKGVIGQVLKWQCLSIKTTQLSQIKKALDELLAEASKPNYDALSEYVSWSNTWAGGDMHKGFIIASALLEMQGKGEIGELLKWQALYIKTTQLSQIKKALDELLAEASKPNYDAFGKYVSWSNTWVGGDMQKGFSIASALLEMQGKGEIGEVLKWHELHLKTSDLVFIQQARSRPIIPVSISVPKELVGVITGRSFTGLQKMLSISSKPMTLVQGQGPQLVSSHTSKPHTSRRGVYRASRAIHSWGIEHAVAMLIRDHLIIDQGIKGALALAPEIEIVAPVAANDDVEHTLHAVADTAPSGENQLNPSSLADQSLAPHLFGSAHLVSRAGSHHVLRVVP